MKLKKIVLFVALTLLIIGCILVAGCTSSYMATQPTVSDNSEDSLQTGTTTVKMVAHRGLSSEAPENTLASFKLACENGNAWGVECDIFKTSDNIFIISHDESMKRMCGVDKNVTDLSLSEIQKYKITSGNNREKYPNEVMPSLEQYLQVLHEYPDVHAVIEIKQPSFTDEDAKNLLNLCKTYLPPERLCFIGEGQNDLLKLQSLDSSLKLQWIGDDYSMSESTIQWCLDNGIDMDIKYILATPELAKKLHNQGLELNVWTINDRELAKDMVHNIGVDYLTSNYIYDDSLFNSIEY